MMKTIKRIGYRLLMSNKFARYVAINLSNLTFPGSAVYWERRYRKNGNSGVGSYGDNAVYKAGVINRFVVENNVKKVTDLGCGDGNQLKLFDFPLYVGIDVSATVIDKCISTFEHDNSKNFYTYDETTFAKNRELIKSDLVISLDVIYHLLEDEVYEKYMCTLFSLATRFVIIYAWDVQGKQKFHVRHRRFSDWISRNMAGTWRLVSVISNREMNHCDFHIYKNVAANY